MKLLEEMKKYFEEDLDQISANSKFKNLDDKDIDNDGDIDDTDSYLHNKLSNVAKNVKGEATKPDFLDMDGDGDKEEPMKKAIKDKKTNEANVTGNLDGGEGPPKTPYAFGKKEDEKKNAEKLGFKKTPKTNKHYVKMESTYKKMIATMEGLNEVSYRDYKKDPTSTPQQKVNRGIMEVNRMLAEMEKIVNNNLRLKTEMGVQSSHFWKATGKRFSKINERMLRVANRLKELSQWF